MTTDKDFLRERKNRKYYILKGGQFGGRKTGMQWRAEEMEAGTVGEGRIRTLQGNGAHNRKYNETLLCVLT